MSDSLVDQVVAAALYEGYLLYPYRPSSVKNRQRWTFGGVVPRAFGESEPWAVQAEALGRGVDAILSVRARFLHLQERIQVRDGSAFQEAVEREVVVQDVTIGDPEPTPIRLPFSFPAREIVGDVIRRQESVEGVLHVSARRVEPAGFRVTVRIENVTPLERHEEMNRDAVMPRSLISTHIILHVRGGEFVSLTDPPDEWHNAAAACRHQGVWPVLVGEPGRTDTLLCSPIILPDYPQVAPESPGDLFDATEIDEILTLRILTLTDDEKRQMIAADERARRLLERTESLTAEQMMKLHGTLRTIRPSSGEASR